MEKQYEALKDILEDQIKKIVKKGDISPQELDALYKASAVVLDFETKDAMKKAEEEKKQGGQSQGNSNASYGRGSYRRGSYEGGSNEGGQSNHYPWFMYAQEGGSNDGMSNRGNSYDPIWNQGMENKSMHELQSQDSGMSNRRGVRGTGRGNSRDNSYNRSYEGAYEGAYDGAYDGSYEGAYDGSYDGAYDNSGDNSYRRGRDQRTGRYTSRDRGYSRAMDKERMIGKLQDMMDDAPSNKERMALQQCVDKLERQP